MNINDVPQIDGLKTIFTPEGQTAAPMEETTIIHIPSYVHLGNDVVNLFMHLNAELPQKTEFQNMLQYVYFSHMVAFCISEREYDQIIFEDKDLRDKILLQFHNQERYENRVSVLKDSLYTSNKS